MPITELICALSTLLLIANLDAYIKRKHPISLLGIIASLIAVSITLSTLN